MTLKQQAGSVFIGSPALGLQSSLPALEPHGVRWCRSGAEGHPWSRGARALGGSSEGGKKGLMSLWHRACTEHIPADRTAHGGLWPLLTSGPSGLPPPRCVGSTVSVPLARTPRLLQGRACQSRLGRVEHTGQDAQSCAQMVPQRPLHALPGTRRAPLFFHSVQVIR